MQKHFGSGLFLRIILNSQCTLMLEVSVTIQINFPILAFRNCFEESKSHMFIGQLYSVKMNPHNASNNLPSDGQNPEIDKVVERRSCKRSRPDNEKEQGTSSSLEVSNKVPKLDNDPQDYREHPPAAPSPASLLTLSDDVLLQIFKYLDSATLTRLSRTCHRIKNIAADSTLWTKFDTNGLALSVKEFRTMLKYFNKRTTSITIQGFLKIRSKMHHESVTSSILDNISEKCPDLNELRLKDCFIDAKNGISTKIT